MNPGGGRHTAKILGLLLGGLVAGVVLLLLIVWVSVNPNDYKGRIEQAVRQSTGRELTLTGPIKLSLFPWVALELGPAELGNPAGFGDAPFLALTHASVRVRLWPLLHRTLSIGRIDIEGLDLRLLRNAAGQGNWEGFGRSPAASPPAADAASGRPPERLDGLEGIRIADARLSYQDLVIDKLTLESGRFANGEAVPIALSFELQPGAAAGRIGVDVNTHLTADFAAQTYALAALSVNGTLALTHSGRSAAFGFDAPTLALNLAAGTLTVPAFTAQLAAAHLSGSVSATQLSGTPAATGSITLAPVDLRELMARLDLTAPATRDPKALALWGHPGLHLRWRRARSSDLRSSLDESTLAGQSRSRGSATAVTFALSGDHIDLDRYRPPPGTTPDPKSAAANAPGAATGRRAFASARRLRHLRAGGGAGGGTAVHESQRHARHEG